MKQKKQRLIDRLLEMGACPNEREAAARVMAGEVYVGGQIAQNGAMVRHDDVVTLKGTLPYASKGGFKLSGALQDFGLSVSGRVCIDAGASTGGFTDCLVQRGAALVYAVDVGFGQLMGKLRQDAHVVNLERTNIGDEGLLALSPRPDFGTVDVSYLSLRKAIPYFSAILHGQGELCCLIKPLFEIDDAQARRTGVIAEESYAPLLLDLIRDVNAMPGAAAAQITHSHVTGNAGTREFFLHVALGRACPPIPQEAVYAAVARAQELERYKKS
ncbi:MAG: TlyA family RNA methyltransferase [Clostridiales bacterium]|nr:TlyA family RNA methyltransferase [Clostridiales bacterium]